MRRTIVGRLVSAAALLSVFVLPSALHAQDRPPTTLRYQFASVGLVRGQSLRVSVVNLVDPPEPEAPPNPDIDPCWRLFLVDAEGRHLADSGDIELPPGRTRTFTVDRARLGRGGDARTGHIQVRAVVMVENENRLVPPPDPDKVRLNVEVLATATGHTMFGLSDPPEPDRVP